MRPCQHGNYPMILKTKNGRYRSECKECRCGKRAKFSDAPIYAAYAWNRTHRPKFKKKGKIIIRPMRQNDIVEASKIVGLNYHKSYEFSSMLEFNEMFRAGCFKPDYLVCEKDSKIVAVAGYSQSACDYAIYEIFWVNVHPDHQGMGIGTAIVKKIIAVIKAFKSKDKKAEVIMLTAEIQDFYRKFGFESILKKNSKSHIMALKIREKYGKNRKQNCENR